MERLGVSFFVMGSFAGPCLLGSYQSTGKVYLVRLLRYGYLVTSRCEPRSGNLYIRVSN